MNTNKVSSNISGNVTKQVASKIIAAFFLITSFSFSTRAMRGGFSVDGGNVIAPTVVQNPQNPIMVSRVIEHARLVLPHYLIQKENDFKRGRLGAAETAASGPLLRRKNLILNAMKRLNIAIETRDACHDRKHLPLDGSTMGSQPNTICMSALSLSRRVKMDMMPVETAALPLHEY